MIITEYVKVKTYRNSYLFKYKELGYDISNEFIDVKIEHLSNSSTSLVEAKCDYCGNVTNVPYKRYLLNINNGNLFSCSKKCSQHKIKETLKRKYNIEHISQLDNIKDKVKKTNIERYGGHPMNNEEIKEKYNNTNLMKYGGHPMNNIDIKSKIENNNLEKYNNKNVFSNSDIKDKIKQTNIERYGGHPLKNKAILDKLKKTNLERYGYEFYKIPSMVEEYCIKNFKMSKDINYIKYLGNGISLFQCDCGKDHTFEINTSNNYYSRKNSNLPLCTICYPINDNMSIKEKLLLEYIKSIYDGEIISGYRDGLEIDIYLPELNIGFEFNGLYWHSSLFLDRNYHLDKQEYFKEKGIRIIYIWEDDWDYKTDIIKSQIKNWLGLNNHKIYARKCTVKEIKDTFLVRDFLDNNHIQGFVGSTVKLGLYHNDELVSIMTFDKFEGRKLMSNGYNLSRFCNLLNTNVIGAASKLLKYFINNYDCDRIISYADKSWSLGDLYRKLGFQEVYITKTDYQYIIDNKRVHKSNYRKINENLFINKVYDCGKIKYELKIKE